MFDACRGRVLACFFVFFTMALSAAAGPKESLEAYFGKTFYLKYNLFVSGFDADWKNELGEPDFIPIATKVKVSKVKSDAVYLDVEGKKRPIKLDLDDVTPDAQTFLGRLLGSEPPSLEGLSTVDSSGIKAAAVTKGMSRRAVFLAVGYPPYYFTPHIPFAPMVRKVCANRSPDDAPELTYLQSDRDFVRVTLANDIVVAVDRD
ncbi:MAG: hypothetical protein ACRD00_01220 [Thermoanaerobaculia bacterium]